MRIPTRTDVLVVGAGPAGAAAAAWTARLGMETVLADAATFPRDKTCGDGLTPRAIAEMERLGLGEWVRSHGTNRGLRAAGFGQELLLPWPGGSLPDYGSAVPRTELDDKIFRVAIEAGATPLEGARAVDAERDASGKVISVTFQIGKEQDSTHDRLRPADRRRRRTFAARSRAGPRVAPRDRVRRRRPLVREVRPQRRPVDLLAPRAARPWPTDSTSCSPATAGSSRCPTARSISASARSRRPKGPLTCRYVR